MIAYATMIYNAIVCNAMQSYDKKTIDKRRIK
jgi:hypothetical protein